MRKLFFTFLFFLSVLQCDAQISIIKTNPLSVFAGFVSGCWEQTTNTKTSYQISAFVGYDIEGLNSTAIETILGYRRYITKKDAPRGFYLMPYAGANYTDSIFALKTGLDLGYQWMWQNGVILDVASGPDYYLSTSDSNPDRFNGAGLNLIFKIGYSF